MFKYIFRFDNTYVGDIDEYIIERVLDNNKLSKVKLNIQGDMVLSILKYKNDFPLILAEVKSFFNISPIRYNICSIDNIKYLCYENINQIPLNEYLNTKDKFIQIQIKKILAFNNLMSINSNYESNIQVFSGSLHPFVIDMQKASDVILKYTKEKSFVMNGENEPSKSILGYFDSSLEKFQESLKSLANDINPSLFKNELLKIVRRYDEKYITWVNIVYQNLLNAKEL